MTSRALPGLVMLAAVWVAADAGSASAELVAIQSERGFGVGMAVRHNERCYVLTPAHVAGGNITRITGAGRSSAPGQVIKDFSSSGKDGGGISVDLTIIEVPSGANFTCSEPLPSIRDVVNELQNPDTVLVKHLTAASSVATAQYFISSVETERLQLKIFQTNVKKGQVTVKGDSGSIVYQNKIPVAMVLSTEGNDGKGAGITTALRFDVINKLVENYFLALQGNKKIAQISKINIEYNPVKVLNNPFYKLGEVDGVTMAAQQGVIGQRLTEEIARTKLFEATYGPNDRGPYPSQVFSTKVSIAPENSLSVAQCSYLPQGAKEVQVQKIDANGNCPNNWTRSIKVGYAFEIEVMLSDRLSGKDFVQKDAFQQGIDYNFQSIVANVNTVIAAHTCVLAKQALKEDGNPKLKINRGDSLFGALLLLPVNLIGAMAKSENATSNKPLC